MSPVCIYKWLVNVFSELSGLLQYLQGQPLSPEGVLFRTEASSLQKARTAKLFLDDESLFL